MNNDLISREALKKFAIPCEIHNGALTELCVPLYQIDNAPTVEINEMTQDLIDKVNVNVGLAHPIKDERQKGEWIYHDKLNMYYCKDCGLLEPFTKGEIEEGIKLPNYCSNCGAYMKGGAE